MTITPDSSDLSCLEPIPIIHIIKEDGSLAHTEPASSCHNSSPSSGSTGKHQTTEHQYSKTKICKFWKQGACLKAEDCNFAHGSDLRELPDLTKTRMCPEFVRRGKCDRGPSCSYAHCHSELRSTADLYKTSMCLFHSQGHCPNGDSCRYAHSEEELRPRRCSAPRSVCSPRAPYLFMEDFGYSPMSCASAPGGANFQDIQLNQKHSKRNSRRASLFRPIQLVTTLPPQLVTSLPPPLDSSCSDDESVEVEGQNERSPGCSSGRSLKLHVSSTCSPDSQPVRLSSPESHLIRHDTPLSQRGGNSPSAYCSPPLTHVSPPIVRTLIETGRVPSAEAIAKMGTELREAMPVSYSE